MKRKKTHTISRLIKSSYFEDWNEFCVLLRGFFGKNLSKGGCFEVFGIYYEKCHKFSALFAQSAIIYINICYIFVDK